MILIYCWLGWYPFKLFGDSHPRLDTLCCTSFALTWRSNIEELFSLAGAVSRQRLLTGPKASGISIA
ncbi:hypothetical protein PAXRUDRAFT_641803 [Paxillus rubicundulus Ve08.2h10]|uniref:Uncharacterized protein n=1 Tax=Paxillus rubicundulus Ve08.2h10 TaxID=930991 RepID=A0A0D0DSN2_9AGAM|nr:hypothetical protein PAXRUDRAFT_641803 [Paxillus rubicundulus Ve08.2h10]